jgi:hypothetical protein
VWRARHACVALPADGRHVCAGRGRNAAESHEKAEELLAEFEKLSSGDTQPEAAGFFKMVKDFFGTRAN